MRKKVIFVVWGAAFLGGLAAQEWSRAAAMATANGVLGGLLIAAVLRGR